MLPDIDKLGEAISRLRPLYREAEEGRTAARSASRGFELLFQKELHLVQGLHPVLLHEAGSQGFARAMPLAVVTRTS